MDAKLRDMMIDFNGKIGAISTTRSVVTASIAGGQGSASGLASSAAAERDFVPEHIRVRWYKGYPVPSEMAMTDKEVESWLDRLWAKNPTNMIMVDRDQTLRDNCRATQSQIMIKLQPKDETEDIDLNKIKSMELAMYRKIAMHPRGYEEDVWSYWDRTASLFRRWCTLQNTLPLVGRASLRKWRWAGHLVRLPDSRMVKQVHDCRNTLAMMAATVLGLHPFGTHWSRRRWEHSVEQFSQKRWGVSCWVCANNHERWEEAAWDYARAHCF